MQVIGLGGGEQDAVDARAHQFARQVVPAGAEAGEDRRERVLQVVQRRRAGVEGGERVDQHDLPVEPREMLAEERTHDRVLISLEAPLHHGPQRLQRGRSVVGQLQRRKGERG